MKVKLTYLDLKGIAEPIRLALHLCGVSFEDERISHEEVHRRRVAGLLPFGQVPVLAIDGQVSAQAGALLRWAGRQGELYPDALQLHCDSIEEALADIRGCLKPQWYGHALGRHPETGEPLVALTEEQRAETERVLNEAVVPARLAGLEQALGPGPFFCGPHLTICDLSWYVMGTGLRDGSYCQGISPQVLGGCPGLVQLLDRVAALPRVRQWEEAHTAAPPAAHAPQPQGVESYAEWDAEAAATFLIEQGVSQEAAHTLKDIGVDGPMLASLTMDDLENAEEIDLSSADREAIMGVIESIHVAAS